MEKRIKPYFVKIQILLFVSADEYAKENIEKRSFLYFNLLSSISVMLSASIILYIVIYSLHS